MTGILTFSLIRFGLPSTPTLSCVGCSFSSLKGAVGWTKENESTEEAGRALGDVAGGCVGIGVGGGVGLGVGGEVGPGVWGGVGPGVMVG